jgi:hypothetical protein
MQETANREQKFHWSRQKRRQDIDSKRKAQKRDWMQKMYKEGLEEGKSNSEGKRAEGKEGGMDDELDDEELLKVGVRWCAMVYNGVHCVAASSCVKWVCVCVCMRMPVCCGAHAAE